jgi:transposase-like protein
VHLKPTTVWRKIIKTCKRIPNSNHVTEVICEIFSGYLQIDAKYISVRGNDRKMAFIWAIDYYTHDVVWWTLASSENYEAYYWVFKRLRFLGYQLKCLICDDHKSIQDACTFVFPNVHIQLCLTHYKRNIQKLLDLRNNSGDRRFFKSIKLLFASAGSKIFHYRGKQMVRSYGTNPIYLKILAEIDRKYERLTTYLRFSKCPSTTNLIEGYNRHLADRIKSISGFKRYDTAALWLNSYVMWRRTTELKSCKGKFKHLNGKLTLGETAGRNAPEIYFLRD